MGSRARSAHEPIRMFAEVWRCGIANSSGAVGIVPDSHPLMLSGFGEGCNPFSGIARKGRCRAGYRDFLAVLGNVNSILSNWIDGFSEYDRSGLRTASSGMQTRVGRT
ncbi:hypothetical protein [Paenibacillus oceani]|uniref:hypothetical protein n=1 Tax=Paenibacillus oceani TaxID=2772510 RepID=UPI0037CCAF73